MSANTSWLKKPAARENRMTLALHNTTENNFTLSMAATEPDTVFRPPKRKSCMVTKGQSMLKMPQEKSAKIPVISGRGPYKSRTLLMMDKTREKGPGGGVQVSAKTKPRQSQFMRMQRNISNPPLSKRQSQFLTSIPDPPPPLHMSTPRSILKNINIPKKLPAAKQVNFDDVEGVCALEESTIDNLCLPQLATAPLKKDVGTITDHLPESSIAVDIVEIINKAMMKNNESVLKAIDDLKKMVSALKTPQRFCLDVIKEESEPSTPTTPLIQLSAPTPSQPDVNTPALEGNPAPLTPPLEDSNMEHENDENSSREISPIKSRLRKKPVTPIPETRTKRKRLIPKYFNQFEVEMSPKTKISKMRP